MVFVQSTLRWILLWNDFFYVSAKRSPTTEKQNFISICRIFWWHFSGNSRVIAWKLMNILFFSFIEIFSLRFFISICFFQSKPFFLEKNLTNLPWSDEKQQPSKNCSRFVIKQNEIPKGDEKWISVGKSDYFPPDSLRWLIKKLVLIFPVLTRVIGGSITEMISRDATQSSQVR